MGYPVIKAGSITNLSDARYFSAKGADLLGFSLEEGLESYLEPGKMQEMRGWIEGPKIVGEFEQAPIELIVEAARFFQLDAVQLPYARFLQEPSAFSSIPVLAVLNWPVNAAFPANLHESVDYFVLQVDENQWNMQHSVLKDICSKHPVLLDLQMSPENMLEVLRTCPSAGLHLRGGEEEKTGIKSFETLDQVFDALEVLMVD